MRRVWLALLLLILPSTIALGEVSMSVSADWLGGLYGGVECRAGRFFGFRTDLGISLMGGFHMDALCCIYTLPKELSGELNILFGVTNFVVPFSFPGCILAVGGSLQGRHWFNEKIALDLRLGAGYPFFFEGGERINGDMFMFFFIWPDLMLGVTFKIDKGPGEPGPEN